MKYVGLRCVNPMKVDIADKSICADWNGFITSSDHHFFHYFEWSSIFEEAYGFRPLYIIVRDDSDKIIAGYPLFYTKSFLFGSSLKSMPYHIEGGAVFRPDVANKIPIYEMIISKLLALQSELKIRNVDIKFADKADKRVFTAIPEDQIRIYKTYYRYIVNISIGEDKLFESFRQDVRNSVRRAKKFGVRAEVKDSPDSINIFYKIYILWSKGIGLPGHSELFFRLIWDVFAPKGMAKIVFAYINNEPVAAKLFLLDPSNRYVLQNWGTITDFRLKKYQVNTALHWAEIKWCIANKYKTFDFGVTSEFNKGAQYFKKGWATKEELINFCNIGDFSNTKKRDDHNAGGLFRLFWKKMPLSVIKNLGPLILKQGN